MNNWLLLFEGILLCILTLPFCLTINLLTVLGIKVPRIIYKIYGFFLDEIYENDVKRGSIKPGYEDQKSVQIRIIYKTIKDQIDKM